MRLFNYVWRCLQGDPSSQFNRTIRYKAGAMGYSLNQRGLYSNVIRDSGDRKRKLHKGKNNIVFQEVGEIIDNAHSTGTIIASETEEEIFRILG